MATDIMMKLGSFKFSIPTATYQKFTRTTAQEWPEQKLLGQLAALQYTGPGRDEITLEGSVYPYFQPGNSNPIGWSQIETLRQLAATGQPQMLVDGLGKVHGKWAITVVEETTGGESGYFAGGFARRQDFRMTLLRFSA